MVRLGLVGLLAALLLVLPLVAACARSSPSPVNKPRSVKVGRLTDLTSPSATISPSIDAGLMDYAQFLNKRGGIDGVPVEIMPSDVTQDAALSVSAYQRFKEQGCLVVSALSSAQTSATRKLAEEVRIPVVTQAMNLSLFVPPSDVIWGASVAGPGETVATLIWFDTRVWDRTKMGKSWKIGFLVQDNADAKGELPPMYKYCDDNDIEMVATEITPATQLDFAVTIRRLVDAGANVIMVSQPGTLAGIVLKQMGELGVLAPLEQAITTPGKIVPLFSDSGFYVAGMLAAPKESAYAYGATPWASWFETDKYPGIVERNNFMTEKYGHVWHSALEDDAAYSAGWNSGRIITAAIERAVKTVGWDKLNGEAVIQQGLKGLKLEGNMTGDLSYADYDGDRIAVELTRSASFDLSRAARVPIGDDIKVDQKYYVTKYTPRKPHPGMFAQ